ncbi:hypothetical protein [Lysinibacillus sp. NPDC056232]|uniref:hypothetical protein n=1 Tax=Lysinibacillus sp. NPDC056232 TaxID=3345756 RepID=UPI0035E014E2
MKVRKVLKVGILSIAAFFLTFSGSASATTFTGGKTTAIKNAYYTDSVYSLGYQTIFDEGKANWNALSSKVQINWVSSSSGLPDKYYVGTTSTAGLLGYAPPYKYAADGVNFILADTSDKWAYSTVSAYDNQIKALRLTRTEIVSSVTTHEIGHTLSLAHSPSGVSSVMTKSAITNFAPTTYDKNDLVSKWGK